MKLIIYILTLTILIVSLSGCVGGSSLSEINTHNNHAIPPEYTNLIDDYKKIVDFRISPNFEENYNNGIFVELSGEWASNIWGSSGAGKEDDSKNYRWHCMVIDMVDYIDNPSRSSYGYIVSDINKDGISELFWVASNYRVLAMFTMVNNEVFLLDAFCPKYDCIVLKSGEIFTKRSITAHEYRYAILDIDNTKGVLNSLLTFGKENDLYYKETDGKRDVLSEQEYEHLYKTYPFIISDTWRTNDICFLE